MLENGGESSVEPSSTKISSIKRYASWGEQAFDAARQIGARIRKRARPPKRAGAFFQAYFPRSTPSRRHHRKRHGAKCAETELFNRQPATLRPSLTRSDKAGLFGAENREALQPASRSERLVRERAPDVRRRFGERGAGRKRASGIVRFPRKGGGASSFTPHRLVR